jgi:hypothetical protein
MDSRDREPHHELLSAYRAREPRRVRDPFASPTLRDEIARIAEARARQRSSGWRSALFGWIAPAPRGALAGAALSTLLLLGSVVGQVSGDSFSAAQVEAGGDPLATSIAPEATMSVKSDGGDEDFRTGGGTNGLPIITGAALLLLSGSLVTLVVSVRRRRA